MSVLNNIKNIAEQHVADTGVDMNQAQSGGGGGRLLPEGNALARLIGYVELGNQENTIQGKTKIQPEFFLTFALFGNTPSGETFHNEDGSPAIRSTFSMNLSQNEKAKAYKLFKAMNPKGVHKHFAQLLNETFIVPVKHVENAKDKTKKNARLDLDNVRCAIDPISYQPYPVPEIKDEKEFKLFLWDSPTQECWDSLFIEGSNDDGKSKNWIQEKILGAVNFAGSALEQMLGAGGKALPTSLPESGPAASQPDEAPFVPDAPSEPVQEDTGALPGAGGLDLPMV